MKASEYLENTAEPGMPDKEIADLARRLISEQGGKLTGVQSYRLLMLAFGPTPLTNEVLQTAEVVGESAI